MLCFLTGSSVALFAEETSDYVAKIAPLRLDELLNQRLAATPQNPKSDLVTIAEIGVPSFANIQRVIPLVGLNSDTWQVITEALEQNAQARLIFLADSVVIVEID